MSKEKTEVNQAKTEKRLTRREWKAIQSEENLRETTKVEIKKIADPLTTAVWETPLREDLDFAKACVVVGLCLLGSGVLRKNLLLTEMDLWCELADEFEDNYSRLNDLPF